MLGSDSQVSVRQDDLPQDGRRLRVELRGLADLPVPVDIASIGTGTPVVFLHGLVGLNDHWEQVVARTKANAKCVLFQVPLLDLEDDDCSIDGVTELTARFLQQHVGEPAVLVGNSFGGHVALRLAIGRPDLVRGLVLAGSSGLIEKSMVSDIQIRPSRGWLERKIGELFHDRSKMNPADVDRAYEALSNRRQARAMVKLSRSARRNHLGDELHRIACHTLILWGRQDIVTPPEACDQFRKGIKSSDVVWLDDCGHAPMIERPDEFASALLSYVAALP
jgi:pimeloyl-ACP methyl ester carboxylesterase